ncbi:MAG: HEPN domain-containing protein [Syntrophales bacterium]
MRTDVGAVNRIYYAMFYAVSALAFAHGFTTVSHNQLRGYFNREFVKTGLIATQHGKAYGLAFDSRKKGDYDDLVEFEKEQVNEMLCEATEFLHIINQLVNPK